MKSAESPINGWVLTLTVSNQLLGSSSEESPAIHVSSTAIRIEACDGAVSSYSLPAEVGVIDTDRAACRISRRRNELRITWPAEEGAGCDGVGVSKKFACVTDAQDCERVVEREGDLERTAQVRDSLDYSRFAGIGAEQKEEIVSAEAPIRIQTGDTVDSAPNFKASIIAPGVPVTKGAKAAIDYSRFEDVDEQDATLTPAEIDALWHKHCKSRRMRGDQPMAFDAWRRARAKCAGTQESLDPPGRGLWCRTNFEEAFEKEAGVPDSPLDDQLPALAPPEHLSALKDAPGASMEDVTAWAKDRLKEELMKACSTDRSSRPVSADVRIDAITHSVELEGGNAAVVVEGGQFLCGYRFRAEVSYCVNVSERPAPAAAPKETQFFGDVRLSELKSGAQSFEDLASLMRTSLRDPKPPRGHLEAMKPVLAQFELSLAYFIRRFERRFLAKAASLR